MKNRKCIYCDVPYNGPKEHTMHKRCHKIYLQIKDRMIGKKLIRPELFRPEKLNDFLKNYTSMWNGILNTDIITSQINNRNKKEILYENKQADKVDIIYPSTIYPAYQNEGN